MRAECKAIRQTRRERPDGPDQNRFSDRISIKLKRHAVIRCPRQVVACDELHELGLENAWIELWAQPMNQIAQ